MSMFVISTGNVRHCSGDKLDASSGLSYMKEWLANIVICNLWNITEIAAQKHKGWFTSVWKCEILWHHRMCTNHIRKVFELFRLQHRIDAHTHFWSIKHILYWQHWYNGEHFITAAQMYTLNEHLTQLRLQGELCHLRWPECDSVRESKCYLPFCQVLLVVLHHQVHWESVAAP